MKMESLKYVKYSSGSISTASSIPAKAPPFAEASIKNSCYRDGSTPRKVVNGEWSGRINFNYDYQGDWRTQKHASPGFFDALKKGGDNPLP
jgi:hypothetical protein